MTYFEDKARLALRKLHADETQYAALAKWAEEHKGEEEEVSGVIVTRDGRIVAETFRVDDGVVGPGDTYVDRDSTDIELGGNRLDLALGAISHALGEPVCHIPIWDLTQGSGDFARAQVVKGKRRMSGAELKKVRHTLGFTGPRLAGLLAVRYDTLRKWESDKEPIPYALPDDLRGIVRDQIDALQDLAESLKA